MSLEEVKANFARYDLLDRQVVFVEGFFSDTAVTRCRPLCAHPARWRHVKSTYVALEHLYPKLSVGGFAIIDDYDAIAVGVRPSQIIGRDSSRTRSIRSTGLAYGGRK